MKRIFFVILFAVLGLLAACTSTEPTAESQDAVMGEAVTPAEANMEMAEDEEAMAEEEMADDESGMEEAGVAEETMEEMATEGEMSEEMVEDDQDVEHEPMDMADEEMTADDESMDDMDEEMEEAVEAMALPAWGQIVLTNARTGESFSLSDFAGKTVFVEPMATWCTNCRQQLNNVVQARMQLMGENTAFVALSLETNISDAMLAEYADAQGFDWLFAVMTPEMLQQLADQFGRVITSAPSTPHFIIRPDGSFTDLVTGIDSPEQIVELVQAASG